MCNTKKEQEPRHRRLDLINSMVPGTQQEIAFKLGISKGYVSSILNGKRNQSNVIGINVIRLAERYAEQAHRRNRDRREPKLR